MGRMVCAHQSNEMMYMRECEAYKEIGGELLGQNRGVISGYFRPTSFSVFDGTHCLIVVEVSLVWAEIQGMYRSGVFVGYWGTQALGSGLRAWCQRHL